SMVSTFCNAKVSLENPDVIIYLIFTDDENFFGFSSRFETPKRPEKLTKFHHELDWKLTRAMINLARINDDEMVCDPFCGTGGIVTDLPYGTASKVSEPPKKIIKKFISKMPKKTKFAIMCKKGLDDDVKLNLTKKYEIYRHKSLTRMILVK
ncbi:MAG: RNA methyltransferase, partial [Thaumarchaeota archaeon]|nr:RNA methyltransferase [Nitrososphaerota archaeon]